MEDTMIERVARAISGHFGPVFDDLPKDRKAQRLSIRQGDAYCDTQDDMLEAARAAIEAMREPTERMVQAGWATNGYRGDMTKAEWSAMIDVALGAETASPADR